MQTKTTGSITFCVILCIILSLASFCFTPQALHCCSICFLPHCCSNLDLCFFTIWNSKPYTYTHTISVLHHVWPIHHPLCLQISNCFLWLRKKKFRREKFSLWDMCFSFVIFIILFYFIFLEGVMFDTISAIFSSFHIDRKSV